MDYEKKYKNALNWIESIYPSMSSEQQIEAEGVFPELAESEDERIRKWCISHFKAAFRVTKNNAEYKEYLNNKVIPWLEKQGEQKSIYTTIVETGNGGINAFITREIPTDGEQKPVDKIDPKFKVGDWLQYRSAEPFLVEEITEQGYINGNSCLPFEWENEIHLWNIQDAKDGDVLVDICGNIGIHLRHIGFGWRSYCSFGRHVGFLTFITNHEIEGTHPATPTQRDLLFQKMEEDGYMWDSHAKMLICSTNIESK